MSEPIYGPTTERMYLRLPEMYRVLDGDNQWQFKTYLSAIADQLEVVNTLTARLQFVPLEDRDEFLSGLTDLDTYTRPDEAIQDVDLLGSDDIHSTSDLVDARTANPDWFEYLALLLGVRLPVASETERREALFYTYRSYRAGTTGAINEAVGTQLTGTKYTSIRPHSDVDGPAGEWDVLVITRPDETPIDFDPTTVLGRGGKPAGVILHYLAYSITWDIIEDETMDWDDVEATGSWAAFELLGS